MRISDWSSDVCSSDLLPGQRGQPLDLTVRIVGDADRIEVGSIQAGQHGHRHDPGVGGSGGLGIFEHRASAGGMDRQYGRLQRSQSLARLGVGVGDVVVLEVEEDGQVKLRHVAVALAAIGGEEFAAEDRKSVGYGKSVSVHVNLGGLSVIKQKKKEKKNR